MNDHLFGMPLIRKGDTVYLIGKMPSLFDLEDRMEQFERLSLSLHDYRCPFSILSEFDQWFEWHRRKLADKQPTGRIITTMLTDLERIKQHKIDRVFPVGSHHDFGVPMPMRHSYLDC